MFYIAFWKSSLVISFEHGRNRTRIRVEFLNVSDVAAILFQILFQYCWRYCSKIIIGNFSNGRRISLWNEIPVRNAVSLRVAGSCVPKIAECGNHEALFRERQFRSVYTNWRNARIILSIFFLFAIQNSRRRIAFDYVRRARGLSLKHSFVITLFNLRKTTPCRHLRNTKCIDARNVDVISTNSNSRNN